MTTATFSLVSNYLPAWSPADNDTGSISRRLVVFDFVPVIPSVFVLDDHVRRGRRLARHDRVRLPRPVKTARREQRQRRPVRVHVRD